jgi:spermidine synthase
MSEKPQYGQLLKLEEVETIHSLITAKSNIRYVKTAYHGDVLLMDDEIQLSTMDEYRYHEMLVHPVMSKMNVKNMSVLILGGGDGCAAREVFKWSNVDSVTIVDWDFSFVFTFGKRHLSSLNKRVYERPHCKYVCDDAISFLNNTHDKYDVVFIDFPDPETPEMQELYMCAISASKRLLKPKAALGMHVGPVSLNPVHPNWKTIGNCKDMLLHTFAGRLEFGSVYVPSFSNEWGFLWLWTDPQPCYGTEYIETYCKYWKSSGLPPVSRDIDTIYKKY